MSNYFTIQITNNIAISKCQTILSMSNYFTIQITNNIANKYFKMPLSYEVIIMMMMMMILIREI